MSLFDVMLIGHLVGDFLFQLAWMARYKSSRWMPLIVHVCVYTVSVGVCSEFSGGIGWWAVAFIWVTHFVIDRFTLGAWWAKHVQGVRMKEHMWLNVVADQILHVIVLAIVAWTQS